MEWESFDIALEKRCDAWSYGSVLLEMLTGKAPWSELSEAELADKAKRGAPPPLPDKLPGGNAELLAKAREFLALDPNARPHFDEKLGGDFDLMLLIAAVNAPSKKKDLTSTAEVGERLALKNKMRHLIEVETQKDADSYAQAWAACEREVTPYAVASLKADCGDLKKCFTPEEDLRQPVPVKTARELVTMASAASETFHATLRPLVERAGGKYEKGPQKIAERIDAKACGDYDGDVGRVVDVERATGVFTDLTSLGKALAHLFALGLESKIRELCGSPEHAEEVEELRRKLDAQHAAYKGSFDMEAQDGSGGLVIRRAKDRINKPMNGYMDMLINVEIGNHVGELQLTIERLKKIKGSAHRIYDLTRAKGGYDRIVDVVGPAPKISLLAACKEGNTDVVRTWLIRDRKLSKEAGYDGKTPLFIACENGHAETARVLVDNEFAVDQATEKGETPLYMTCRNGHVDVAELLLESGADINIADGEGRTPLFAACWGGDVDNPPHLDVARLLLDKGADVNQGRNDGTTPLYAACENGHVDTARLLLEHGAAFDRADLRGTTPLAIAKRKGHTAIVELIEDHMYPLHAAARTGDVDALERLLAAREAPAESAGEESSDDGWDADCRLKINGSFTGQSDDYVEVARLEVPAGYKARGAEVFGTWRDQGYGNQKGRLRLELSRDGRLFGFYSMGEVAPHSNSDFNLEWDVDARAGDEFIVQTIVGGGGGHELHLAATLILDVYPDRGALSVVTEVTFTDQQGDRSTLRVESGRLQWWANGGLESGDVKELNLTGGTVNVPGNRRLVAHLVDPPLGPARREMLMQLVTLARSADVKLTGEETLLAQPEGAEITSLLNVQGPRPSKAKAAGPKLEIDALRDGATPLCIACQEGHVDAARLLLDKGAEVDRAKEGGFTPLYIACENDHVGVARLLLEKGAEVNQAMKGGWTPLIVACENGHVDLARLLLNKGADIDRAEKEGGWAPLLFACQNGHVEAARLLLDRGARLDGKQLMDVACKGGHVDVAKLLMERGARIDHVDQDGSTALHRACHTGDVTTAETFLKLGAAIDAEDKQGRSPLFVACERGTNDAARMLLREGATVDQANNLGWTPLHVACKYGRVDSARLLLDNGAEVDRGDQKTFTPLYNACVEGHVSAAKLLLECGADANRVLGTEKREGADFPPAIDVLLADGAAPSGAMPMMVMAPP